MSGRASRARLLAPSFVVVVSALACGGTMSGGGPNGEAAGSGGSKVGTGGSGYGSYGGTGNPPFPTPQPFAGQGGCGCINPPAPVCPMLPPQNGTACYGPLTCNYNQMDDSPCPGPMTFASCAGGVWQVSTSITSCNPPPTLVCPPTLPVAGSGCFGVNPAGLMCTYAAQLCPREDAWCQGGIWHVDACEPLGMGGIGNPPFPIAGAGGEAGAY